MKEKKIIKLIKTKDTWNSEELINLIKEKSSTEISIKFCYIGGYECLKDGTQTEKCESLQEVQNLLKRHDIEYDVNITDPFKLVDSIKKRMGRNA